MKTPLLLDPVVQDGIVFPANRPFVLSGSAPSGRTVRLEFLSFCTTLKATNGRYEFEVPAMEVVDTPFSFRVRMGFQSRIVTDCLIGDVYLMIGGTDLSGRGINRSTSLDPMIRVLSVPEPSKDLIGPHEIHDGWRWNHAEAANTLAFRFASDLRKSIRRPIGIVIAARPNAGIASMMNPADFYRHHRFESMAREILRANQTGESFERPGHLFEDLLVPLKGIAYTGIVFAQDLLEPMAPDLLEDALRIAFHGWRRLFDQPALPIVIAQFADCLEQCGTRERHALIREAQGKTVDAKNNVFLATSAVFEQMGSDATIVQAVLADRLVKAVLERIYKRGRNQLSPSYFSHSKKNGVVIYTDFNWLPLVSRSNRNLGFLVSFDGITFEPITDVKLQLNQIVLGGVQNAKEIRYDFADHPLSDIGSQNGLPLLPFRLQLN